MRKNPFAAIAATGALLLSIAGGGVAYASTREHQRPKPTIVLVHGALEDASVWHDVVARLQRDGFQVIAPAVPLRSLQTDTAYLNSVIDTIDGPVVLAGHSWGGMLISAAAATDPNVKALVYVSAFIPEVGESAGQLNGQFPGSLIGPDTTFTRPAPDGVNDLYIKPQSFRAVFDANLSSSEAAALAATQRPINAAAFDDKATATAPASIHKYAIVATEDHAIPPAAERFMAKRADATIVEVRSPHLVQVERPATVTDLLEKAASR